MQDHAPIKVVNVQHHLRVWPTYSVNHGPQMALIAECLDAEYTSSNKLNTVSAGFM